MKRDLEAPHRGPKGAMMSGLVSIVVCAYNNWPDVEMTIESALHQSYQPIEIIVVDNSSTDATPEEIPRRFGSRVRYTRQPNRGDAGAYNTGFDLALGEFIQFVDGDDVLAPNKIEKQVEVFRANPDLDIVYGDVRMFQTLPESAHWKDVATKPEEDMLKALIAPVIDWVGIVALGTLFHRRALERVGSWDEGLYVTDMDYWLRAAHLGCRFGHCSGSIMGFQRRRSGQMTANESAMAEGLQAVWEKTLTYLTHEPYRSLLAVNVAQCRLHLARIKFRMAFSTDRMSRREALAKLSLARATNPEAISALAYVVGYAVITLPGGAALVRSRWLGPIRRRVWKDWYES